MRTLYYLVLIVILASCASKTVASDTQIQALATAVDSANYTITAEWAIPLDNDATQVLNALQPAGNIVNGNRVYLDGGSQIHIIQDSIAMDLPYFGTRQISGGIAGNMGIRVYGAFTSETKTDNKHPNERSIAIKTQEGSESYNINVRLFATGKATLVVNSNQRESIRYTGTWE